VPYLVYLFLSPPPHKQFVGVVEDHTPGGLGDVFVSMDDPRGTRYPIVPPFKISRGPPESVATTGLAAAIASITIFGNKTKKDMSSIDKFSISNSINYY